MRLLPRDPFARLAWVWLIYLVFLLPSRGHDTLSLALTIIGVMAFLPLYFWGYWLSGRRVLIPIAGIAAIAMLLLPTNPGASVFFVFASAFAGRIGGLRVAALVIGALALAILIEAWWFSSPLYSWGWPLVITVLIGGAIAYSTDATVKLRVAQDQARHMAVIAERERIGRDLHDLLGHTLSVIALKSELASKLSSRDPEKAFAEIRDVERISREALDEVRRAVQASRPATLAEELQKARTALDAAGIALVCVIEPVSLARVGEEAMALAIREGVTNVIRHSSARHCEIRINATGQFAHLDITDDGVGGTAAEGSGLAGMRTRITQLGGRLQREGHAGIHIAITLPLATAALVPPTHAELIA